MSLLRTRWAAVGAAVAVTLGTGGIGLVSATNPGAALTFVPITPCRVIDTRPAPDNVGPKSSPLGPDTTHIVTVHGTNGNCTGIPTTAKGVSLNVTAVGATQPTFLTIWATGKARPEASNLNPTPGQPPTPNAVTTNIDSNGQFNIYNLAGSVHVLADINGYYLDHNHDDRYYTKAQTQGAIEDATEVIHLQQGYTDTPNYTPISTFGPMTFETTSAGDALIAFEAGGYRACSTFTWYYMVLDDVPIESSVFSYANTTTLQQWEATVEQLAAGPHEVKIGAECALNGSPTGTSGTTSLRRLSIVIVG